MHAQKEDPTTNGMKRVKEKHEGSHEPERQCMFESPVCGAAWIQECVVDYMKLCIDSYREIRILMLLRNERKPPDET